MEHRPSHAAQQSAHPLMANVLAVLPSAVAIVSRQDHRVLAANHAWHRIVTIYRAGGIGGELQNLFPAIGGALADPALHTGPIARRAALAFVPPAGMATWWDLDFVPHPDAAEAIIVVARDVSEDVLARREAEETRADLDATSSRLLLVEEATGIGIWECNVATGRQAWSPTHFRLLGLDPRCAAPLTFEQTIRLVHPEDRAGYTAALLPDGRTGQEAHQIDIRIHRADTGEERWLMLIARSVATSHPGDPARLVGISVDVTRRRRGQQALAASEARLRMAFEAAQMSAWDWDIATGRVHRTGGSAEDAGADADKSAATAAALRALVHPEDRAAMEAALARALGGEDPGYHAEFRMRRADGTWRWTRARGLVVRDAHGRPTRLFGVDHDVTEQHEADALLRESAARFSGMFDSMGHFVGLLAPDGTILKVNRAALECGGATREQVVGSRIWESAWFANDAANADQVRRAVAHAATGKFVRYQLVLRGATRTAIVDFSLRPVRDASGAVILLVPEGHDVTRFVSMRAAPADCGLTSRAPPHPEAAVALTIAEPLLSRLQNPRLRPLVVDWFTHTANGAAYPSLACLNLAGHGLEADSFVAVVEPAEPPLFHYVSIGTSLTHAMHRHASELVSRDAIGAELLGTLDGAYRRCMRTGSPFHQVARYDFGDGAPCHFERLILPISADGRAITHLLGLVFIAEPE